MKGTTFAAISLTIASILACGGGSNGTSSRGAPSGVPVGQPVQLGEVKVTVVDSTLAARVTGKFPYEAAPDSTLLVLTYSVQNLGDSTIFCEELFSEVFYQDGRGEGIGMCNKAVNSWRGNQPVPPGGTATFEACYDVDKIESGFVVKATCAGESEFLQSGQ
jgi:hypothetical protein